MFTRKLLMKNIIKPSCHIQTKGKSFKAIISESKGTNFPSTFQANHNYKYMHTDHSYTPTFKGCPHSDVYIICSRSQDSIVDIATGWLRSRSSSPGRVKDFLKNGSGVHITYQMGTWGSFCRGKVVGAWSWPLTTSFSLSLALQNQDVALINAKQIPKLDVGDLFI
jgi:hypothetical protein